MFRLCTARPICVSLCSFLSFLILTYASSSNVRVFPDSHTKSPYDPWGELASKLDDEHFRAEYVHLYNLNRYVQLLPRFLLPSPGCCPLSIDPKRADYP